MVWFFVGTFYSNKLNLSLTPITFSYEDSNNNLYPDIYSGSLSPDFNYETDQLISGDYNGDGNLDVITYNGNAGNQIHIYDNLYDSTSGIALGNSYSVPSFDQVISNNMLNHENKLLAQQGIGLIKENLSGGTSTVTFRNYYSAPSGLYHQYTKSWNSPTYLSETSCDNTITKKIPKEFISGDFNGDGMTDVLAIGKPYNIGNCVEYTCGGNDGPGDDGPGDDDPGDPMENNKKSQTNRGTCCSCSSYTTNYRYTHLIDLNRNLTTGFVHPAGGLQEEVEENSGGYRRAILRPTETSTMEIDLDALRRELDALLTDDTLRGLAGISAVNNWATPELPTAAVTDLVWNALCRGGEERYRVLAEACPIRRTVRLVSLLRQTRRTLEKAEQMGPCTSEHGLPLN